MLASAKVEKNLCRHSWGVELTRMWQRCTRKDWRLQTPPATVSPTQSHEKASVLKISPRRNAVLLTDVAQHLTLCILYNEITHKDEKGGTHVRLAAKHRLQEWLQTLPKGNKALSNPFMQTPLYSFSAELTAVWDPTSSQMSTRCVCFFLIQTETSATCSWDMPLLLLVSRTKVWKRILILRQQ